MNAVVPSPELREVQDLAREVARGVAAPRAAEVDATAAWPEHTMRALGEAGLLGLHVPRRLGGRGLGHLSLALATEELGRACGSSALVFGMHCVGTAVIAVKATRAQEERYLAPIAAGRHVTTLALSEPGSGAHFYLPGATFRRADGGFVLEGAKSFVTSGGQADSYVVSVVREGEEADPGTFSCLLVDADAPGLDWLEPWAGLGMRGNSSRGLRLNGTRVPEANLLGEEGDETWYMFEVVLPYFLVAMAATYLGIAQAALDRAVEHLGRRRYHTTGEVVGAAPVLAHRLGDLWTRVERARRLLHHAARSGEAGGPGARLPLFACKAEVADVAVDVTNEAMTLVGGIGYGSNAELGRLLRDARAGPVMAPTTDLLKTWIGRSLLGLPLL